jgi:hypothetical protein
VRRARFAARATGSPNPGRGPGPGAQLWGLAMGEVVDDPGQRRDYWQGITRAMLTDEPLPAGKATLPSSYDL